MECVKIAVAERKPEMRNWSDKPKGRMAQYWLWIHLVLDTEGRNLKDVCQIIESCITICRDNQAEQK